MTVETLQKDGFGADGAFFKCLIGELEGKPVAYALYFHIYSTWTGRGLYLEDLYVTESARGNGVGTALIKSVGQEAVATGRATPRYRGWNGSRRAGTRTQGAFQPAILARHHPLTGHEPGLVFKAYLRPTSLGCKRFQWQCIDWNERSVQFYKVRYFDRW